MGNMKMIKQHPKLYVMDNGTMRMDKNYMIAMHNPATIDHPNQPNEFVEFPVYTVLIDHPEGKILFDTACNPNAMGPDGRWGEFTQKAFPINMPEECYLHHRLEELNVRPEDIKYVVASHLHLDHAGCLELFTNATIIVQEDEFNGTLQTYARNVKDGAYIWGDIDMWIKNNLQWRLIKRGEDNVKLAEGIQVLNFGSGHAWGMLGLHINMPDSGGIILASDAIYTAESFGPPVKPPGIIYDSVGYNSTVERIRRLANETNSQVWFGHDPVQFKSFRKSTEGYYE
ncbi:N-acyl homoserine lactonase family protein [Lysinibacillus fusiformis]|uniref:MBL fold metallo-hydrolase n=2 Tax=Bacillaceae TaxID=186817 RepID=A0A1E4RBB4_9BACI|nr:MULTISPECIES: N-acyl homoserine lactonase family protein [Lysinibacillus]HBI99786.1 N-acyl homoserine lactonase family protein [Lysinibacillus sp.]MBD8521728.1 N-acyl homoserine lactonase family protein [Lysinibacillus fusiformis]MCR8853370.1 N-acyl homoserine lactonase family protein [Lysinibacillus fusiformis]ODV57752.1 MBL fold metallo-hydrolase [Lysinibacillus fusiformis]WKT75138.1 N-acyl homoserine lactonase family protein [Lysinibacillus fusiformis]